MLNVKTHRPPSTKKWLASLITLALAVALSVTSPAQAAVPSAYAFVQWNGTAVVPSATTPTGTGVGIIGTGQYKIVFPGVALSGGVAHVTAINSSPHWCQVNTIAPVGTTEVVTISCHLPSGALDPTPFSAIWDARAGALPPGPGAFGYVDSTPAGALISTYNSALAGNVVTHLAVGVWSVTFTNIVTPGPMSGSFQATAVGAPSAPAHCEVSYWNSTGTGEIAQVLCFQAGGAPVDTGFTLSYQYMRPLWGGFAPPKFFGYAWNTPPIGPALTNYNNITGPGTNVIAPAGAGLYFAQFPSLAQYPDDVQVTAFGSAPVFCGMSAPWMAGGTSTVVSNVNCFNPAGVLVNNGFLISDNTVM